MVAYIFRADNSVTNKTYIGVNYSVKFDKKYIGNNPGVLSDVQKHGVDKFTVNMIRACETVKDCEKIYSAILKELNAENDINYYNCKANDVEEKPKKSRKKKGSDDESLSDLVG